MKHLKIYEEFDSLGFNPEMITFDEYQRVKQSGIHLRFSARDVARLYHNSGRGGPGNFPRQISWLDGNQRGYIGGNFSQVVKNVELRFSTRLEMITIEKEDEPFVYFKMDWGYRNKDVFWRDYDDFPPDSKLYGRMEYEEFEMMRENHKLWKDFCIQKAIEEDKSTHKIIKESFGGEVPEPEPMDVNEWDDEMDNIQVEHFTKNEQELFKSLYGKINPKYRKNILIDSDQLLFRLGEIPNKGTKAFMRGSSGPTYRSLDIVKNDDEFYFVELWKKGIGYYYYKCDGFECFKNFLDNTFNDFKDFIESKTKRGRKSIKESFGGEVPEPEPMDVNEWDDEVTNVEEIDFNQREKELFIALSDTISLGNKIKQPWIAKSSLEFTMVNGLIDPKLKSTTVIRTLSTYKNDDEFYYIAVWERGQKGQSGEKLFRCDGYECWEKFLRKIFADYRELTKQTKTNESVFDEVPEAEKLNSTEWNKELNDRKINFNKKEKQFLVSLSKMIPEKHKIIDALYIRGSQLTFSLANGEDKIYPNMEFDHSVRSTTSYKTDDEFYYVNAWDCETEHNLYRCDGYECWQKFMKELFEGYRKLTEKTS